MTVNRRGNGKPDPQSRILVLAMLAKAGPQGVPASELMEALHGIGLKTSGAWSRLFKDKGCGLIFGKGAYLLGRMGITYRYFSKAEYCDAYVFEDEVTPETTAERRRADDRARYRRWKDRLADETPEKREARLERERQKRYARLGITELPPKRPRKSLKGLTEQEFREYECAKQREYYAARKGRGEARSAAVRQRAARPGKELVVARDDVDAPVQVTKRPTLVGEPVITSATKVTIAPVQRDYRWYVDPETVRPTFGAMKLGQYLTEEAV